MAKKLFLSNSQINTYTDCPKKWWLDKQKRLRPNYKGSALLFGSAIDAAVEHILLKKGGSFHQVFLDNMNNFEVNGKEKNVTNNLLDIRFSAGGIDESLVEQGAVDEFCADIEIDSLEKSEFLEYCKQKRKRRSPLEKTEQKLYNFIALESLLQKGLMMLDVLDEWIQANVEEVHSVQKKIDIENMEGDHFIGYLDFVVTMKSGKKVLIDLKTSSNTTKYYPPESASESRQLGIYAQEEGIRDVAYLVVDKKIRVREPRVRLAFIEGVITEEHLDEVFDEIEDVTLEIKEKLSEGEEGFPKNTDSCYNFGGCYLKDYCFNGNMCGLEYVK